MVGTSFDDRLYLDVACKRFARMAGRRIVAGGSLVEEG